MSNSNLHPFTTLFAITFFIFTINTVNYSQQSKWQIRLGYEYGFVEDGGVNDKNWVWRNEERNDAYFQMKATNLHTAVFGIKYDALKWLSLGVDYKHFFRRYYLWPGTFLGEEKTASDRYSFINAPTVGFLGIDDKSTGARVTSNSWQFGLDFHHSLSKSKKWHMHYLVSLNFDNFERGRLSSDIRFPLNFSATNQPTDINDIQFTFVNEGNVMMNRIDPHISPSIVSTNLGLAVSRGFQNGMGLRLEIGFRDLKPYRENELYWNLFLEHSEIETNAEGVANLYYYTQISHKFSMLHDGIYGNLSFTFRPFRSKYDDPDFVREPFNWNPKTWFGNKNKLEKEEKSSKRSKRRKYK